MQNVLDNILYHEAVIKISLLDAKQCGSLKYIKVTCSSWEMSIIAKIKVILI